MGRKSLTACMHVPALLHTAHTVGTIAQGAAHITMQEQRDLPRENVQMNNRKSCSSPVRRSLTCAFT